MTETARGHPSEGEALWAKAMEKVSAAVKAWAASPSRACVWEKVAARAAAKHGVTEEAAASLAVYVECVSIG